MISHLLIISLLYIIADIPYLAIAGQRWKDMITRIQGSPADIDLRYAGIVYVFLAFGLYNLVLVDAEKNTLSEVATKSFMFGFASYGVFNFTSAALYRKYDIKIALADTLWGGVASALVGTAVKLM